MNLAPPDADEFEVSLFGRGYGEAICVHTGNGDWILVDSCTNPDTGRPAALSYLEALGLVPSDVVRLLVVTHWDDDHIRGVGEIAETCTGSRVACSAALARKDIVAFVLEQEAVKGALGSGLDEFRRVLFVVRARNEAILWAKANLPLFPLPPGVAPTVVALSPSEDAYERSIESLIEAATDAKSALPRRYRAPEGPNGASVVTLIRAGDESLLLGADLEVSGNEEAGWDGLLKYAKPPDQAAIVKIPHHGSEGAHHEAMWTELIATDPIAMIAPWARGAKFLPTEADLDRIRDRAQQVFLTAVPSVVRVKKDAKLEKLIRRLHGDEILELRGWGHVQARKRPAEADWRVELDGDAVAV